MAASMGIFDLPEEIQTGICSHCSQCDLICLSLVSSRFRELAAAQLYRNFHIVFPDEDDPCFDSPIDGLAGGLDTFVTSDYNYAKHLRDLSLDTLSAGDKAEIAYKPYLASVSCGKFMNTLLLLTLRRAKLLDTFRWNIRVELSRPVYKALHDIDSLRNLHIRLQAGPSLYELPPPLPYVTAPSHPNSTTPALPWNIPDGLTAASLFGPPPIFLAPPPAYKPSPRSRPSSKSSTRKEPPTISGFRNLETLSVLDIDNLDVITEIKMCVRNSAATLKKLKLSFSDALATQARKPCLDTVEPEESDPDDDFQVVPLPTTVNFEASGPAKAFRAQEERKAQEAVLGRVFDIEPCLTKTWNMSNEAQKKTKQEPNDQAKNGQGFVDAIGKMSQHLMAQVHGISDLSTLDQQEMLDTIMKAARKYVDSQDQLETTIASSSKEAVPSATSVDSWDDKIATPATDENQSSEDPPFKQQSRGITDNEEMNPEDIDVTAPEEQLAIESQEEPNNGEAIVEASPTKTPVVSTKEAREPIENSDDDAGVRLQEARTRLESISREIVDIRHGINVIEAEVEDVNTQATQSGDGDEKEELRRRVNDYARGTRGIGLHSLSIHLIPIKASVLGRAIDLHMLKRITLLNVGSQAPFWVLMNKENRLKPLQLRKIFTDNVSLQFLHLVSELSCVHEFFLLERVPKYKPESLAPRTKTTIEQIYKFALKKHMSTLKRLMIKNKADSSWDVDKKTTQLICRRGKVLEELAVTMGMNAVHVFIQNIHGLVNLRALQLISFRHEDTCLSVMRETRRFIVDAVAHYPQLKLEYLCMVDDERVTRIVRKPRATKKTEKGKGKGKETSQPGLSFGWIGSEPFSVPVASGCDTESDSDEDDDDEFPKSELELNEHVPYYDIWGVRIFKKEVVAGRL
ncbi:hypothetical protein F5X99DRAFT_376643 [Biscogniauxia marginata]|nr:hypothetical protein F5X99DRAFT_376643 [Biscogniauxia marginata]